MAVKESQAYKGDGFKNTVKSSETARLAEVLDIYSFLEFGNRLDIDHFREAAGYYTGTGHWTENERQQLEGEGRPPLTFNFIFSKINTVAGLEQQIRSGFKAIPIGAEDDDLAMLATALLKHEDYNKKLQKVFSRAFKSAAIAGRSWIEVGVQQKPGELSASNFVRNENLYNVYKDPDSREIDMSDATYLARQKWLSIPQLRRAFPDIFMKKSDEEIFRMMNFTSDTRYPAVNIEYENDYPTNQNINDWSAFVDNQKRRAKIIELWTKRIEYAWYVVSAKGRMMPADDEADAIEQVKVLNKEAENGNIEDKFDAVKAPVEKIYQDTFSGNMMIRREELSPYKHNKFPLVPVYAYLEDTGEKIETFGIVKNLIDPQDEKNKRHSQFTDILNRAPKGGGFFQQSSIDAEQIKALSSPGAWIPVRGNLKDKVLPSAANFIGILGHYQWLEASSQEDAKEISGVNDSLVGIPTNSRESGVAAQTRIQQGLTSLQELFDNLNTAKQTVLDMVISNVQQFYDTNKIDRIIGIQNNANPDYFVEATRELKTKFYDIKYDILIDEGESSPTARIASVQSAKELLQYAQSMPPGAVMTIVRAVIEMSDFPGKSDIIAQLEQAGSEQEMQAALGQLDQQLASQGN